jgi:hypothetical protein
MRRSNENDFVELEQPNNALDDLVFIMVAVTGQQHGKEV